MKYDQIDRFSGRAYIDKGNGNRYVCIEMLLTKWDKLRNEIYKDLEDRLAITIKDKIKECSERTNEVENKLASI